jgi:hypothetical protein
MITTKGFNFNPASTGTAALASARVPNMNYADGASMAGKASSSGVNALAEAGGRSQDMLL